MSSPRERILASIRGGLLRNTLPAVSGRPSIPPGEAAAADLIGQFSAALIALSGHVHRAVGITSVAETIAGIAQAHQAASFISWDEEQLGCPGLLDALSVRGLTRITYDLASEAERRMGEVQSLAGVGMGLTGAHAALGENGGLVLVSGAGRGRLVSLLPPVHIAIANERRLRPSLAALLREEPRLVDAGANLVVVAGPSRTADIEMTLTHGVHGPKHVHVILTT